MIQPLLLLLYFVQIFDLFTSGKDRAFLGIQPAQLEDQIEKEIQGKLRKNRRKYEEIIKFSSLVYPRLKVWPWACKICAVYWAKITVQRGS